jgi:large conductance mechanosensitive channel
MKGFINFVREQGVVGLAVGFLLGGAVSKLVTALITDIINPLLGLVLGIAGNFKDASLTLGPSKLMWGDLLAAMIDFAVIAAVVYFGVHGLGLDKIDKPKDKKKAK